MTNECTLNKIKIQMTQNKQNKPTNNNNNKINKEK